MYAMCTGRPPFRADTSFGVLRRITDSEPRPIREVNTDIPAWFAALIAKLLAKQPADRFASAGEAAKILEQCLAHVQQPSAVPLPAAVAQLCRAGQAKGQRTRLFIAASISLFLLAGSAATYFATGHHVAQSPAGSGSSSTSQQTVVDESLSTLEWDSTAQEIEGLSTEIDALQQKADQLWDTQSVLAPPPAESAPNRQPTPELLP
jgi:serine/threonine protein kinase